MRFFQKRKPQPRLYLGDVFVVKRQDWKRFIDQWSLMGAENFDCILYTKLRDIFELPLARDIRSPEGRDLAIDIIVPRYQLGAGLSGSLGGHGLFFFWHPKIQVKARIYRINTGKTLQEVQCRACLGWKAFFSRIFSIRGILPFQPTFDSKDMEPLLYKGCLEAIEKLSSQKYS